MNEKRELKEAKTYFDSHDKTHQTVERSRTENEQGSIVQGWLGRTATASDNRVTMCNFNLKVQPTTYRVRSGTSRCQSNQKIKVRMEKRERKAEK